MPIALLNVPLVVIQLTTRGLIPAMEFVDDAVEWMSSYTLKPFFHWWRINKDRNDETESKDGR